MGRMRVARRVGVLVVSAVLGDPHQVRPLDGHRAEDGEDELHHDVRLNGAVDEQRVVADRDPQGGQDLQALKEAQIGPAESPASDDERGGHHAEKRDDDGDEEPSGSFIVSGDSGWALEPDPNNGRHEPGFSSRRRWDRMPWWEDRSYSPADHLGVDGITAESLHAKQSDQD